MDNIYIVILISMIIFTLAKLITYSKLLNQQKICFANIGIIQCVIIVLLAISGIVIRSILGEVFAFEICILLLSVVDLISFIMWKHKLTHVNEDDDN